MRSTPSGPAPTPTSPRCTTTSDPDPPFSVHRVPKTDTWCTEVAPCTENRAGGGARRATRSASLESMTDPHDRAEAEHRQRRVDAHEKAAETHGSAARLHDAAAEVFAARHKDAATAREG